MMEVKFPFQSVSIVVVSLDFNGSLGLFLMVAFVLSTKTVKSETSKMPLFVTVIRRLFSESRDVLMTSIFKTTELKAFIASPMVLGIFRNWPTIGTDCKSGDAPKSR